MRNSRRPEQKILTEENARRLLAEHFDDIALCVRDGLTLFRTLPPALRSPCRNRTLACLLNDLIVDRARTAFQDRGDEVVIFEKFESTFFVFDSRAALRFKKTVQDLSPQNYPTDRQLKIRAQTPEQLELEGEGFERVTFVDVSYRLDPIWTSMTGVTLCCWRNTTRLWTIPIAGEVESSLFDDKGSLLPDVQEGPVVRVKAKLERRVDG